MLMSTIKPASLHLASSMGVPVVAHTPLLPSLLWDALAGLHCQYAHIKIPILSPVSGEHPVCYDNEFGMLLPFLLILGLLLY